MCTCVNCDDGLCACARARARVCVCVFSRWSHVVHLRRTRPGSHKFRHQCNRNNWGSIFPLFVSIDCAAERSCPQSGAPSPSQSTSSHTLSSAKSKGSLRRQSKSVVWSLLCTPTFSVFLLSAHVTFLKLVHPSLIFHILQMNFTLNLKDYSVVVYHRWLHIALTCTVNK